MNNNSQDDDDEEEEEETTSYQFFYEIEKRSDDVLGFSEENLLDDDDDEVLRNERVIYVKRFWKDEVGMVVFENFRVKFVRFLLGRGEKKMRVIDEYDLQERIGNNNNNNNNEIYVRKVIIRSFSSLLKFEDEDEEEEEEDKRKEEFGKCVKKLNGRVFNFLFNNENVMGEYLICVLEVNNRLCYFKMNLRRILGSMGINKMMDEDEKSSDGNENNNNNNKVTRIRRFEFDERLENIKWIKTFGREDSEGGIVFFSKMNILRVFYLNDRNLVVSRSYCLFSHQTEIENVIKVDNSDFVLLNKKGYVYSFNILDNNNELKEFIDVSKNRSDLRNIKFIKRERKSRIFCLNWNTRKLFAYSIKKKKKLENKVPQKLVKIKNNIKMNLRNLSSLEDEYFKKLRILEIFNRRIYSFNLSLRIFNLLKESNTSGLFDVQIKPKLKNARFPFLKMIIKFRSKNSSLRLIKNLWSFVVVLKFDYFSNEKIVFNFPIYNDFNSTDVYRNEMNLSNYVLNKRTYSPFEVEILLFFDGNDKSCLFKSVYKKKFSVIDFLNPLKNISFRDNWYKNNDDNNEISRITYTGKVILNNFERNFEEVRYVTYLNEEIKIIRQKENMYLIQTKNYNLLNSLRYSLLSNDENNRKKNESSIEMKTTEEESPLNLHLQNLKKIYVEFNKIKEKKDMVFGDRHFLGGKVFCEILQIEFKQNVEKLKDLIDHQRKIVQKHTFQTLQNQ